MSEKHNFLTFFYIQLILGASHPIRADRIFQQSNDVYAGPTLKSC